jgi:hypothetical protein
MHRLYFVALPALGVSQIIAYLLCLFRICGRVVNHAAEPATAAPPFTSRPACWVTAVGLLMDMPPPP